MEICYSKHNFGLFFYFQGKCNCGATIQIKIDNEFHDIMTMFHCQISKSKPGGQCKPRQFRGPKRKQFGVSIGDGSIDVYHAEQRRTLQEHGDPEPPLLPSQPVMRQAKHEFVKSQYLNKDPIIALQMLKKTALGQNVIRNIGSDPFFVYIFTSHQIRIWNMFSREVPLIIDSSTGIARKLDRLGSKSHTLALHLGVINCKYGQLAVFEGVTERQDTLTIEYLLKRFLQLGAKYPKQVVS